MIKIIERFHPYVGGVITSLMLWWFKVDLSASRGLDNALNGIITMASLIICFLGAIILLIVSARTDSKAVENVFRLDTDGLFYKYIKETVSIGLALVIACVVTFFRTNFKLDLMQEGLVIADAGLLVTFLLCIYRSYLYIFEIIQLKDFDLKRDKASSKSKRNKALDEELKKAH